MDILFEVRQVRAASSVTSVNFLTQSMNSKFTSEYAALMGRNISYVNVKEI